MTLHDRMAGGWAGNGPGPTSDAATISADRSVDWQRECEVDDCFAPSGEAPDYAPRHILLTGATGFLGSHLLDELLARTDAHVTCIVRADNERDAHHRLRTRRAEFNCTSRLPTDRVSVVRGDLGAADLGLEEPVYRELSRSVDTILNSAATLNFFQPYHMLRSHNVDTVRNVIGFATAGMTKRLHHVSTAWVLASGPYDDVPVDECTPLVQPECTPVGYVQSKWVSEQLVWEMARRGLPVTVYRPSFIEAATRGGACREDDFFSTYLRASLEIGALSASGYRWYVSPVDWVAQAIVALLLRGEEAPHPWHVLDHEPWSNDRLREALKPVRADLDLVPWAEWVGRFRTVIKANRDHPLRGMLPVYEFLRRRNLADGERLPWFCSTRTISTLGRLDVAFERYTTSSLLSQVANSWNGDSGESDELRMAL